MAAALGWITSESASDLHVLRRIRNRFAHNRIPEGLRDQATRNMIHNHVLLRRMYSTVFPNPPASDSKGNQEEIDLFEALSVKAKLITASALSAWTVIAQLYVAPVSLRRGIDPADLLDHESASAPFGIVSQFEETKRLLVAIARIVGPDWDAEFERRGVYVRTNPDSGDREFVIRVDEEE